MTEVLLKARCAAGHDWDIWGEVHDDERIAIPPGSTRCPDCDDARAETLEQPDTLA